MANTITISESILPHHGRGQNGTYTRDILVRLIMFSPHNHKIKCSCLLLLDLQQRIVFGKHSRDSLFLAIPFVCLSIS